MKNGVVPTTLFPTKAQVAQMNGAELEKLDISIGEEFLASLLQFS